MSMIHVRRKPAESPQNFLRNGHCLNDTALVSSKFFIFFIFFIFFTLLYAPPKLPLMGKSVSMSLTSLILFSLFHVDKAQEAFLEECARDICFCLEVL